jgi:hypothetical protein
MIAKPFILITSWIDVAPMDLGEQHRRYVGL